MSNKMTIKDFWNLDVELTYALTDFKVNDVRHRDLKKSKGILGHFSDIEADTDPDNIKLAQLYFDWSMSMIHELEALKFKYVLQAQEIEKTLSAKVAEG